MTRTLYEYVGGYELVGDKRRLVAVRVKNRDSIDFLPTDMLHPIVAAYAYTKPEALQLIKAQLARKDN